MLMSKDTIRWGKFIETIHINKHLSCYFYFVSNIIWVASDYLNIHIYAEGTIGLRNMFPCIRHHLVSFEQNNIIYCICFTLLGNCMKIVFVNILLYFQLNKLKLLPGVKKK